MTAEHQDYIPGTSVFFEHPEESWVVGEVKQVTAGKKKGTTNFFCEAKASPKQTLQSGPSVNGTVQTEGIHPVVDVDENNVFYDDLLDLPYLHDSTLLYHVRKRYYNNIIYTRIGPIVLALNPFDYNLPNYVDSQMPKYIEQGSSVVSAKSELLPHAWSTAHYAYWMMRSFGKNQSCIVSGESGAGKTETAKIVMKYLGRVSTTEASDQDRAQAVSINEKIISTNPIMEAFGNAKTKRNDNSSRFGKFMKIQFNQKGVMIGGAIEVYLLEKSRIVQHSSNERSYHSFYQLLCGASADQKSRLSLKSPTEYHSLAQGAATKIAGVDDAADFAEVNEAFAKIGIPQEDISAVWDVVSGVLSGLQIKLAADGPDKSKIAESKMVKITASCWGVDEDKFSNELTTTTNIVAGSAVTRFLRFGQAEDTRDAVCKALYEKLFLKLVELITNIINNESQAESWIGLLDIFGFEHFDVNSFEQVCINLANEQLQNHYNNYIFIKDMQECRDEGIDTASVVFYDNQPCLDMLMGKTSVLSLLDDECSVGNSTDLDYNSKLKNYFEKHANFTADRMKKDIFIISHYAGNVSYSVEGFREKNMDALKDALKELCNNSSKPFIAGLLPPPDTNKKGGRSLTVGGIFRKQLGNLMDAINSTEPHWIRCVKPHHAKKPRMFHGGEVMQQMRCAGVLETVRIRKMSYCVRFPFDEFWKQFKTIVKRQMPAGGVTEGCRQILSVCELDSTVAQVGKTKVFLKTEGFQQCVRKRNEMLFQVVNTVIRAALSIKSVKLVHLKRCKWTILQIQAHLKALESQKVMRKIELKVKEADMLKRFRDLILLQSSEEKQRVALQEEEENNWQSILSRIEKVIENARKEWARQRQLQLEQAIADVWKVEQAQRVQIYKIFCDQAATLGALSGIENNEERRRLMTLKAEAAERANISIKFTQEKAGIEELISYKALLMIGKEEQDYRQNILRTEDIEWGFLLRSLNLQYDAFCLVIPRIWATEQMAFNKIATKQRAHIALMVDRWWQYKAQQDRESLIALYKQEKRQRMRILEQEAERVVRLLDHVVVSFETAAEDEQKRIEAQVALERRLRDQEIQRQKKIEERMRTEQRQLALIKWRAAQYEMRQQALERQAAQSVAQKKMSRLLEGKQMFDNMRRDDVLVHEQGPAAVSRQLAIQKRGAFPTSFSHSAYDSSSQEQSMITALVSRSSVMGHSLSPPSITAKSQPPDDIDVGMDTIEYSKVKKNGYEEENNGHSDAQPALPETSSEEKNPHIVQDVRLHNSPKIMAQSRDGTSSPYPRMSAGHNGGRNASSSDVVKATAHGSSFQAMQRLKKLRNGAVSGAHHTIGLAGGVYPGGSTSTYTRMRRSIDPTQPGWEPPARDVAYLPDGTLVGLDTSSSAAVLQNITKIHQTATMKRHM